MCIIVNIVDTSRGESEVIRTKEEIYVKCPNIPWPVRINMIIVAESKQQAYVLWLNGYCMISIQ